MNDYAFGVLDKFVGTHTSDDLVALWYIGSEEAILIGKFMPDADLAAIATAWYEEREKGNGR